VDELKHLHKITTDLLEMKILEKQRMKISEYV